NPCSALFLGFFLRRTQVDINTLIAFFSFALALFTTGTGAILWYANTEKKKYAAERDFAHLKRNQESISEGIDHLLTELDRRLDTIERDILEIKSCLSHNQKLSRGDD
ncbi:MAG: hypothetical protein ACIWVG_07105, partial [Gloeotrichia echinulata HAB0833]